MKLHAVPLHSNAGDTPGTRSWLSASPDKRRMERFVLYYTPVWIGVIALVQLTGAFRHWSDWQHMVLGVGLCLPLWLAPIVRPAPTEQTTPFWGRYSTLFNLWIFTFSFLQVYFGSALFFGPLGMEYHFHTAWIVNRSPLFLYFLTVVYFSTYYVLLSLLWRAFLARWPRAPKIAVAAVLIALGFAMAFCETAGMANDTLKEYFSYADKAFVLKYGSLAYGTVFICSLPTLFRLGEATGEKLPRARRVIWDACAATMLTLMAYEVYFWALPKLH